ncbi:MAG: heme ABC transporter ATP-binding protein [Microbacteriaceae bacterium]
MAADPHAPHLGRVGLMLEARGVTVVPDRAKAPILADASISIRPGELHALLGPNGAGKSTLFGVLAGDIAPTSGEVLLHGEPLARHRAKELARLRGVLLQQNAVTFSFTAREVVAMGRVPWSRTPQEDQDEDAIAEAMAKTDVTALADRTVTSLSGGERARVALARVLAQRTRLLLLDEPTAALDLRHHEDVLRIARAEADAGSAVAVVLHDLDAALAIADHVTLLARGRVVAQGPAHEVLTAERIEEVYGQAVDVLEHPITGASIIVPRRSVHGAAARLSAGAPAH